MQTSVKTVRQTYRGIYDTIARLDIDQELREQIANDLADALEEARAPRFHKDKFVLLATDPLCLCAGPDAEPYKVPCPEEREIRIGMHLSSAPDGRSKAWQRTKPIVRCVPCGASLYMGVPREAA